MTDLGSTPTFLMGDDYLEAPASEPTILGGFQAPCIDLPPTRRPMTLGELLEAWHEDAFGGGLA